MANDSKISINHLSRVSTKNYKNLDLVDGLTLESDLNIFIGPNGSGKSNFCSLLQLLNEGLSDKAYFDENRITDLLKSLFKIGGEQILNINKDFPDNVHFSLDFLNTIDLQKDSELQEITYRYNFDLYCAGTTKYPQIYQESLLATFQESDPKMLYQFHDIAQTTGHVYMLSKEEILLEIPDFSLVYELENIPVNEFGLSILPRLLENFDHTRDQVALYELRRQILDLVSGWRFYSANNIHLSDVRKAEPEMSNSHKYLNSGFTNLAGVLENLFRDSYEDEERFNSLFQSFLPETARIRAIRQGRTKVGIEWNLRGAKRQLYLSDMSDGTVKMLCWAVLLNSPHLPSLLVLDEPELGLHIEWLTLLAHWIKSASQRTQIILVTHSPDLLDKFTDSIDKVRVFEPSKNKGLFHVKHLSQETLQIRLDEGWELGDMYRIAEPEVGGWSI